MIKPGRIYNNDRGCGYYYFDKFREIRKGKDKGKFEIFIKPSNPKRMIVERGQINRFPVEAI